MTAIEPVLRLIIHGTPATAGSKSSFAIYKGTGADRVFTGRTATVEQDTSGVKKSWRRSVVEATAAVIRCGCGERGCKDLIDPYPLDEAIVAAMVFTVRKPVSAPKRIITYPVAKPDALKYARSTEDSLKDAGAYKDDARIVDYVRLGKVYPGEDALALPTPGAIVMLWRRRDLTAGGVAMLRRDTNPDMPDLFTLLENT